MTNPFGISKWTEAGWKPPTPHEVLGVLMTASTAIPLLGITPPGSVGAKLCELLSLVCGGMGIASARNYMSPQALNKLQRIDARALQPNAQTTVYMQPGSDINVGRATLIEEPSK